jgi:glycosyltransferase involved in cell wall biosynthesis
MASVIARPRLLFLCQTLPYPPDGGVWIRTYHVLRLLARAFDITALCFERAGTATGADVNASRHALSHLAHVEVFPIPQRHSRSRLLWDHGRSVACRRVYTTYLYESAVFRRRLGELLKTSRFDLVHVDSLDLASYLPACRPLPVVCVHHDIESTLLARRASVERNGSKRIYLRFQSRLMSEVERRWCERVTLNVVCSATDRTRLKQMAPNARVAVVPNGVDTDAFRPDGASGSSVVFVGGTSPAPNSDALTYFCEEILPHVRTAAADVPVRWIGRASAEQQRFYRDRYDVELTGYVDDERPHMRDAACHIVPLRIGGGTRLKILNAWAMGKPVVSTSCGCEGLHAVDGDNILIRDEPRLFASAITDVLRNESLRHRLAEGGRATVERLYAWQAIGEQMIDTYLSITNATHSDALPIASRVSRDPQYQS